MQGNRSDQETRPATPQSTRVNLRQPRRLVTFEYTLEQPKEKLPVNRKGGLEIQPPLACCSTDIAEAIQAGLRIIRSRGNRRS